MSETVTVAGEEYEVTLRDDTEATPLDADCYSPEAIAAWKRDAWSYVGVTVTHVASGVFDDLWGLEYDFPLDPPQVHGGRTYHYTGTDYQVNVYPVPDMIAGMQRAIKAWRDRAAVKEVAIPAYIASYNNR